MYEPCVELSYIYPFQNCNYLSIPRISNPITSVTFPMQPQKIHTDEMNASNVLVISLQIVLLRSETIKKQNDVATLYWEMKGPELTVVTYESTKQKG